MFQPVADGSNTFGEVALCLLVHYMNITIFVTVFISIRLKSQLHPQASSNLCFFHVCHLTVAGKACSAGFSAYVHHIHQRKCFS